MTTIPACPRCAGLVAALYDDPHCLNCGWRRCEPVALSEIEREAVEFSRNGTPYVRTIFRKRRARVKGD